MAALHVIRPGLLTTIQDRGRWGFQSRGVPVAGPMDLAAHRVANALVGNSADAATLEVTLIGPELAFEDKRLVAIAGAEFEVTLDGRRVPMLEPFVAEASSRLTFGRRSNGARAYLAVAGGIAVPPVLGSRSTHLLSRMGGHEGRAMVADDRLPLGDRKGVWRGLTKPVAGMFSSSDPPATIRVLPGPHADVFATDVLDALQSAPYRVGEHSNRMGFRLEGPPLRHAHGADIISEAMPLGTLQVPGSGQPILLMADRQTIGGYPKVATVISADVDRAGQLGPGDLISFAVCSEQDALTALIARERQLMALEAGVTE